jgi:hypothetical protein
MDGQKPPCFGVSSTDECDGFGAALFLGHGRTTLLAGLYLTRAAETWKNGLFRVNNLLRSFYFRHNATIVLQALTGIALPLSQVRSSGID